MPDCVIAHIPSAVRWVRRVLRLQSRHAHDSRYRGFSPAAATEFDRLNSAASLECQFRVELDGNAFPDLVIAIT